MACVDFPSEGLVPGVTTFIVSDVTYLWSGVAWESQVAGVPSGGSNFNFFDTVLDLKQADNLVDGQLVATESYNIAFDTLKTPVGGANYIVTTLQKIRNSLDDQAYVPDELGSHTLANGLVAWLLIDKVADVTQYGAKNNRTGDAYQSVQAAINQNRKVYFPDGDYNWGSTVDITGNQQITFSQGAILRPINDNFVMLRHINSQASGSNILIENMFASDFDGVSVGVTMLQLQDLGPGVEIHSPKSTQINTMIDIVNNSFGVKIYSPSSFRVPFPIKSASGGVVGTVDVYSPNLDNSSSVAGGDNSGIGIDIPFSGTVHGGYIQGFDSCIKFGGRGLVTGTYFESAKDEAILFDGAFGVTVINPFFFGFDGDVFFRGRNSESVKIINPVMTNSTATTGIFDFDDTNNGCTYDALTNNDKTKNPVFGITNGIMPASVVTNSRKQTTIQRVDTNIFLPVDTFVKVKSEFPSLTTVQLKIAALEKDGFEASISETYNVGLKVGVGAEIIPPQLIDGSTLKTFNSNYEIGFNLEAVTVGNDGMQIRVYIETSGAITPSIADLRIDIEATTTGEIVNITELD
jgi:hypothetical protein